jgi:hypothetical protein
MLARGRTTIESRARDGHDERGLLRDQPDLAAQAADQHVDAAIVRIGALAGQRVEQIVPAQHPPRMADELAQKREFVARERDFDAFFP